VVARVDSMAASGLRRVRSVLDRVLAELIWLNPASTVLFRSFAVEEASEDDAEDVVSEARAA
jgi:hypothetical protein